MTSTQLTLNESCFFSKSIQRKPLTGLWDFVKVTYYHCFKMLDFSADGYTDKSKYCFSLYPLPTQNTSKFSCRRNTPGILYRCHLDALQLISVLIPEVKESLQVKVSTWETLSLQMPAANTRFPGYPQFLPNLAAISSFYCLLFEFHHFLE